MKIPLVGQNYTARSLAAAAQVTINVYPEKIEDPNETQKNRAVLYGCPGKRVFCDLTLIDPAATPIRGVWSGNGKLFAAAGPRYMQLDSNGALVGSVRTIQDLGAHTPVQFFANGTQLFIVSDGICYVDNGSGPLQITLPVFTGEVDRDGRVVSWHSGDRFDAGMVNQFIVINGNNYTVQSVLGDDTILLNTVPAGTETVVPYSCAPSMAATTGAFLDGYFIVNRAGSRQFNISPLNDGSNNNLYIWDQTDYGIKESGIDGMRSVLAANEQLYLFGSESFEVWQNTGAASFPFERIDGATHRIGSISAWGPVVLDDRVYFLGSSTNGQIIAYVLDGFTPKRISTHAQESQWNTETPTNVYSYSYIEEGHSFWVFHIGAQCWGFDAITGAWHQRYGWTGIAYSTYQTYFHTFVADFGGGAGKHITGGITNGILYESSVNIYDDAGLDIKWQRALPYLYNDNKRMYFGRMDLEMETGTVPSGAEPVIYRDYSDDRGHTWSTPVAAGIGTNSQYSKRVYWQPSGSSYGRVYRLSGTGHSKVALIDLELEMALGTV